MAVRFKTLDLSNPNYRSNDIELITSQGNTIVLPSSRLYPKRYTNFANNSNTAKQSYYIDYNDPYALNSVSDAFLNQEAKRRRYGDVLGSAWLNSINTPIALLDVLYNTTIAPIAAGIKGDDITFGQGLGAAGLNTLMNFGESLDILANPIKGMVIEGVDAAKNNDDVWAAIGKGLVNGLGSGKEGRKNYDYNTGNVLADIGLELVSDPLNWFSFGASTAVKNGLKPAASGITKAATKGFKEVVEEVAQEGAEKIIKETVQEVSQESAERLGKRIQRDIMKLLKDNADTTPTLNPIKKIQQAYNNVVHGNVIDDDTVKALLWGYANGTDDNIKLAAKAALQNYTDETSKIVLDSLDKVKFAAAALRGEETFERFLKDGVMYTSPFIGWKGVKLGKDALEVLAQSKIAKEGVTNHVDYLIKHNILDETLTNVSDVTKKQIDTKVSNYFVKEEIKFLNAARDVYTKVRRAFNDVVTGFEDLTKAEIDNYYTLRELIGTLKTIEDSLQTTFKMHASEYITDFKSYKTYLQTAVDAGYIPAQQVTFVSELETFLDEAAKIRNNVEGVLGIYAASKDTGLSLASLYRDLFKRARGLYQISETTYKTADNIDVPYYKINDKLKLNDTPEAVEYNLRLIINHLENQLNEIIKTADPTVANPYINSLSKHIHDLKKLFKEIDDFKEAVRQRDEYFGLRTQLKEQDIKVESLSKKKKALRAQLKKSKSYKAITIEVLAEQFYELDELTWRANSEEVSEALERSIIHNTKITLPNLNDNIAKIESDLAYYNTALKRGRKGQRSLQAQLKNHVMPKVDTTSKRAAALEAQMQHAQQAFVSDILKGYNTIPIADTMSNTVYYELSKLKIDTFLETPTVAKTTADGAYKKLAKLLDESKTKLKYEPIDRTEVVKDLKTVLADVEASHALNGLSDSAHDLIALAKFIDASIDVLDDTLLGELYRIFKNYAGLLKANTSQIDALETFTTLGRFVNHADLSDSFISALKDSKELLEKLPKELNDIKSAILTNSEFVDDTALYGQVYTLCETLAETYDNFYKTLTRVVDAASAANDFNANAIFKTLLNELPEPAIKQVITDDAAKIVLGDAIEKGRTVYLIISGKNANQQKLLNLLPLRELAEEVHTNTGAGAFLKELAANRSSVYHEQAKALVNGLEAYYSFVHFFHNVFESPSLAGLDDALKWGFLDSISGLKHTSPEDILENLTGYIRRFEDDAIVNAIQHGAEYRKFNLEEGAKAHIAQVIDRLKNKTDEASIAFRKRLIELNPDKAHDALADCRRTAGLYLADEEIQKQINLSPDEIGIVVDLETSGKNKFTDHIHQLAYYSLDGAYSNDIKAFADVAYDDEVLSALYKAELAEGKTIDEVRKLFNDTYRANGLPSEAEALEKFIKQMQAIEQRTGKRVVLLAHNGQQFDYTLLSNRMQRLGMASESRAYFKGLKKLDTLIAWHRACGVSRFTDKELRALTEFTQAYAVALQDCGSDAFGKLVDRNMAETLRTLAGDIDQKLLTAPSGFNQQFRDTGDKITEALKGFKSGDGVNQYIVFDKATANSPLSHALWGGLLGPSEYGIKTVMDAALESKYFKLHDSDYLADHQLFVGWARSIERWRERIKSDIIIPQFTVEEINAACKILAGGMPELFKARFKPAVNHLTAFAQLKMVFASLQSRSAMRGVEGFTEAQLLTALSPAFSAERKDLVATLVQEIFKNTDDTFKAAYQYVDLDIDVTVDGYLTGRVQNVLDSLSESFKLTPNDPVCAAGQRRIITACEDFDIVQKHFYDEYTALIPESGKRASELFIQRDKELRKGSNVFGRRALERFKNQTAAEIYEELYLSGGYKCVALPHNSPELPETLIKGLRDKGVYVSPKIEKDNGVLYYMVARYDNLPKTAVPAFEETLDIVPSSSILNEDILKMRKKIYKYRPDIGCTAGNKLTKDAMERFQIGFIRDVVSQDPDALKYLTTVDELHKLGFFKSNRCDHLVVGDSWAKVALAPIDDMVFDETNNIYKKILNSVAQCFDDENKTIHYLSMYFNNDMRLDTSPIWKNMSDDAISNLFRLNRDNVCVALKESKHTRTVLGDLENGGIKVEVVKFDLNSPQAVKRAREAGAIIIPRAQYATLANTVNKWDILNPDKADGAVLKVLQLLNAITNTHKAGYLASLGTIFRNAFSGIMNNYFTMDQPMELPKTVKHWFQSLADYNNYMDIIRGNTDDIIQIFKVRNVEQQTKLLTELFTSKGITSMPAEYFRTMHSFMQHQASGGLSEDLLKAMRVISDAAEDASPELADKYYKILYSLPLVKQLGNINNIVEHASRWSLYTMQIQNGATVNEAISAVIRTHFDYADKTYAQTIMEVFLPFMTFSMKNLEFYANLVEDCTWVLPVLRDVMTPVWDFDSLTAANEQLYESYDRHMELDDYAKLKAATPWTAIQTARLYHMLAGNLLLPLDRTAYKTYEDYNGALKKELKNVYQVIKLNPAFIDAVSLASNPVDSISNRLGVPYKYLGLLLRNLYEGKNPTEGFDLGDLPLVGPVWQRFGGNKLFDSTVKTAVDKVEDSGNILNMLPSLFSTVYLNPMRAEDVKTPEQMQKFLYKQKMLYQKYGVEDGAATSQVYLNIRRNKTYPRKISFKRTPVWKAINNYKQPTKRHQSYYTTQRNIDRFARSNVYERLYTTSGYSRMALNMGPTTAKNLKYRIAAIKNM